MKDWIIKIISIVIISTILVSLFPKKNLFNLIKSIIGVIVVIVILGPIINLDLKNYEFNNSKFADSLYLEDCSDYLINIKLDRLKETCNEILINYGINGANVLIEYGIDNNYFFIKNIKINLSKAVIKKIDEHIDIIVSVKEKMSMALNIDKESIIFYE